MSELDHRHAADISLARAFRWGFVIGVLITLPAIMFALLTNIGEALLPILAPGHLLLRPFADAMADWPGLLNVGLAAVANGLVYGVVATALVAVVNLVRR